MSLLYFQSHNAVSFNLEHINILFHAFSTCSSGPLCPFIYLCFCPRNILIQNRQFYFDSYLYVKCGGWGACHCSCTLLFAEAAFFFSQNSPRHPLSGLDAFLHNKFSARQRQEIQNKSGEHFVAADSISDNFFLSCIMSCELFFILCMHL